MELFSLDGRGLLVAKTSVPRARAVVVGRQIRLVGGMRTHHAHAAEKTAMPRGQRRANGRDLRLSGACRSARPTIGPGGSMSGRRGVLAGTWATSQVTSPSTLHARTPISRPSDRISTLQLTGAGILLSAVVHGTANRQGGPSLLPQLVAYSLYMLLNQLERVGPLSRRAGGAERRRRSWLGHAAAAAASEQARSCEEACTRLCDRARAWKGSIGTPASRHARTCAAHSTSRSHAGARARSRRSCVPRTWTGRRT